MVEEKLSAGSKIPYLNAYGVITKTIDKIIQAATPTRFTQDFLATKLSIKGGSAKPVIPFLKRTGFLNSDGSPTELYNQFRNDFLRGNAAAQAVRHGFEALYEMNEYVHDLNDTDLKSLIIQATGSAPTSSTVKSIVGSFKALRAYANFEASNTIKDNLIPKKEKIEKLADTTSTKQFDKPNSLPFDFRLGYTINLNLPPTADIAVYDAIFKSLKEHLLEQ